MSRGGEFVVVLSEDDTSFNFVRHFLLRKGVIKTSTQIREVVAPKGHGSGAAFVEMNLPDELDGCRNQNRRGTFKLLIVMTDADNLKVDERRQRLQDACKSNALTSKEGYIRPGEPAAVFIPRRNIETWLRLLDGQAVDETNNYKHGSGTKSCKPQAEVLFAHCQQQTMPENAVASLLAACAVYRNILPLLP